MRPALLHKKLRVFLNALVLPNLVANLSDTLRPSNPPHLHPSHNARISYMCPTTWVRSRTLYIDSSKQACLAIVSITCRHQVVWHNSALFSQLCLIQPVDFDRKRLRHESIALRLDSIFVFPID
jgi:hypothetical protein